MTYGTYADLCLRGNVDLLMSCTYIYNYIYNIYIIIYIYNYIYMVIEWGIVPTSHHGISWE